MVLFILVMSQILIVQQVSGEETPDAIDYWALIVCGDDFSGQSFSRDAGYMYHVLSEHYLFNDSTIYYLHVDTSVPGVDALATKENVRSAITSVLANWSDQNDVVFIFFTDHGGGYNSIKGEMEGGRVDTDGDEGNEIWNATLNDWVGVDECLFLYGAGKEEYWDDEVKDDLNYLASQNKYGKLVLATLACFSGGLIDDISAPSRTIMTAANETFTGLCDKYVEQGGWHSNGDLYSEWPEVFLDALHGKDTYWDPERKLVIHK